MKTLSSSWQNCFDTESIYSFIRKCIFRVLAVGPIPNHIAFIMDGNRRYARNCNLDDGAGHSAGFLALMSILKYCYELGVKYVTVYAFSIDNFKRKPQEVENLMNLMQDKIEDLLKEGSIVNSYGIRVYFAGNLQLLRDPVRLAAEKVMKATANNNNAVLLVCIAYTSTDEILHAIQEVCYKKTAEIPHSSSGEIESVLDTELNRKKNGIKYHVKLEDVERHMYTTIAPDPDILVRTSGETRLSNFLLWQTTYCCLYSPRALWPEISFWHLLWGILNYQRVQPYLEKKKKQL